MIEELKPKTQPVSKEQVWSAWKCSKGICFNSVIIFWAALILHVGMKSRAQNLPAAPSLSGYIRIETQPTQANIFFNGELHSETSPIELDGVKMGIHTIKIEIPKYNVSIETKIQLDQELNSLIIKLSAYFGTLDILTNTPNASIEMNGNRIANGEFSGAFDELSGSISITTNSVENPDDEVQNTGKLSVKCVPLDTEVYIDGISQGTSPISISWLAEGKHEIRLVKNGYLPLTRQIEIKPGETTILEETLFQEGYTVGIKSDPSSALLYFNGVYKGITPIEFVVPPGKYIIRLLSSFHEMLQSSIEVFEDKDLHYNLEAKTKMVAFLSTPSSAQVLVDGEFIGTTSMKKEIGIGARSVTMQKRGFKAVEMGIGLNDQSEKVKFLLYPEQFRKTSKALLYSMLWPGAGQSYLNRGSWHAGFGAVGYGMVGGWYYLKSEAYEVYDRYVIETNPEDRESLKNQWQTLHSNSRRLLLGAGIVWGMNVIWTAIMPDETKKYNVLQLDATYDNISGGPKIGMVIDF